MSEMKFSTERKQTQFLEEIEEQAIDENRMSNCQTEKKQNGDGRNGHQVSINSMKFGQSKSDMENESNYTDRSSAPLNVNANKPGEKQDLNSSGVQELTRITQQIQLMSMLQRREQQLYQDDDCIEEQDVGTLNKPEVEEEPETESSHLPSELEFKWVSRFFYIQFTANLLMMVDMGILPACTIRMQKELDISNGLFGTLGSMVYLGQTIGSVLATYFLQKTHPKYVLCACMITNISSLILFTMTKQYWIIAICRVLTGMFQIFFNIYFPVWADTFGNEKQKSMWLSFLIIASPLGNIVGYILAAYIQDNIGWRWAFYIQSFMMVPAMIGVFIVPGKYMDIQKTGKDIKNFQKLKEQVKGNKIETIATDSFLDPKFSIKDGMIEVLRNKNFIKMCGALTALFFVLTGVQFWFSDYLITVMKVNASTVFGMFGIVSITGPVMGVLVGGYVTTALGGYNSLNSMYVTIVLSIFCLSCAAPIPYIQDKNLYLLVVVLLWFLLFAGGFILPCMTGIMLNTQKPELRTLANSAANICYNLFGFLPAPFAYGFIADAGEVPGSNKRQAMRLLMFMPVACVIFLSSAGYNLKQEGFYDEDKTKFNNKQNELNSQSKKRKQEIQNK